MCVALYHDSVSVRRKAETGRHISLSLWHILQGYRSLSAWAWLSLTCYDQPHRLRLIHHFRGRGEGVGVSWWPRGLDGRGSPVACHSPCTTAWPPTLSGLHNGRSRTQLYEQSSPHSSSQQPTEEGQKESKYSGQALVLYRPWKTSLLEAAEQWISALFPTESLILAVSVGLNSRAQALTETPRDNLLQQTCIAIIQSH